MEKTIAVIRGDGIGPEIVNASLQVLEAVAGRSEERRVGKECRL